jgi:hydrogenase maturation protein HypF
MLPYTPLHHVLLRDVGRPLVMTSGNVSDEPIAFRDADALDRLAAIADAWLVHDRPIETRTEDSIVRLVTVGRRRQRLTMRRSRGYVPDPIALPFAMPEPVLGCGAELKSTFCLAVGRRAWPGPHLGDLRDYEALRSFVEGIDHFERLIETAPGVVAHDLHPEYLSSKYAADRPATRRIAVQHHHAHLAACLAEHGVEGPVAAAVFDGAGLGTDGTVWGGEFLVGTRAAYRRVAHLRQVRLPGGDAAVREPWRMACSWLTELAGAGDEVRPPAWLVSGLDRTRWDAVVALARGGLNSPLTSSIGRLFDAVAALCGLRSAITYEGQAAIELEMAASTEEERAYEFAVREGGADGALVLDPAPALVGIFVDLAGGAGADLVAARFHAGLAAATARLLIDVAEAEGLAAAVLTGGVFQNVRLLEATAALLDEAGLEVLVPVRLPPGDGGIAFGQVAVASAVSAFIPAT